MSEPDYQGEVRRLAGFCSIKQKTVRSKEKGKILQFAVFRELFTGSKRRISSWCATAEGAWKSAWRSMAKRAGQ